MRTLGAPVEGRVRDDERKAMRLGVRCLAVSTIALLAAAPALAGETQALSKIDTVTVFPDAASVTRITEIDLPAGASTVVFKGLPFGLDPASLRVEGEADAKLAIGAVEARVASVDTAAPDNALENKLQALRAERDGVQVTVDALQAKKDM